MLNIDEIMSKCINCNKFLEEFESAFGYPETFEEIFNSLDKTSKVVDSFKEHILFEHLKGD
jgi:hypothetical protein